MPTRRRRVRKFRGSRLHGWGKSGQHRDAGSQGGRGKAGRFKHKKTRVLAEGKRLGKHGFRNPQSSELRTVNVGELERLMPLHVPAAAGSEVEEQAIDLGKLGYQKLLGKGQIRIPLVVTVSRSSKSAAEKVEKAGGKILAPPQV